jgi:hypothetical protein
MLYPEPEDQYPTEIHAILACVNTLPGDEHYVVYDPEANEEIPTYLYALDGPTTAKWLVGGLGYGGVKALHTVAGQGLLIAYGGSTGASALHFWVVPAGLEGWCT